MAKDLEINRGNFLRYTLTPQIVPRFKEVFGTGLYYAAYFIALVYGAVRLLPDNHPYLDARNVGRFGVRHVLAQAADRLIISKDNIDRVLIYFLVLLGLAIAVLQVILLGAGLFVQAANATGAAPPTDNMFVTPHPHQDLALMFMDMVFGVKDLFGSCVSTDDAECVDLSGNKVEVFAALGEYPYPIHYALHSMLRLYSTGLSIIAVLVTIYFISAVILETAQSGTPFGKRFSHVWAPLRIVFAFALIIPAFGSGMSGAQYIVLYAAKYGSGFATNGWIKFNTTLNESYDNEKEGFLSSYGDLISASKPPDVVSLLRFMYVAKTCAYNFHVTRSDVNEPPDELAIRPYLVRSNVFAAGSPGYSAMEIDMGKTMTYKDNDFGAEDLSGSTPYYHSGEPIKGKNGELTTGLWNFADGADYVDIVFGLKAKTDEKTGQPKEYQKYDGYVKPVCGRLRFRFTDTRLPVGVADPAASAGGSGSAPATPTPRAEPGIDTIQRFHWHSLKLMYFASSYFFLEGGASDAAFILADDYNPYYKGENKFEKMKAEDEFPKPAYNFYKSDFKFVLNKDCNNADDKEEDLNGSCQFLGTNFFGKVIPAQNAVTLQSNAMKGTSGVDTSRGWAAAGIWYNKIAEMNGLITESIFNFPQPQQYPLIMEYVYNQKRKNDENVNPSTRFDPNDDLAKEANFNFDRAKNLVEIQHHEEHAKALWHAYKQWDINISPYSRASGNAFVDTIKGIFGLDGLYDMRENSDVHPLSQLVVIGKSLVESAIRNIGYAAVFKGGEGLLTGWAEGFKGAANTLSGFVISITIVCLTMGFILYYIVPFLPFIYFFFALGGWVKGIFEALVGVPLWALAHIRIDGNGLPGQAALNGYFLIFEIFIRPILIVFGFLASVSIFAATVGALGLMWPQVIDNAAGFDITRGLNAATAEIGDGSMLDNISSVIDQFFYTIVYVIIVYMMAMSAFKLIDQVPNQILRWMGSSAAAFNDNRDDPTQGIIGSTYTGLNQMTAPLGRALGAQNTDS